MEDVEAEKRGEEEKPNQTKIKFIYICFSPGMLHIILHSFSLLKNAANLVNLAEGQVECSTFICALLIPTSSLFSLPSAAVCSLQSTVYQSSAQCSLPAKISNFKFQKTTKQLSGIHKSPTQSTRRKTRHEESRPTLRTVQTSTLDRRQQRLQTACSRLQQTVVVVANQVSSSLGVCLRCL